MRFKLNIYSRLILLFILTTLLSAAMSKAYWGYIVAPPSVERTLAPMHTVTQHGFYTMFRDENNMLKLVSASEHAATFGWDESLRQRVPNALHQRVVDVRTSTYFVEDDDMLIVATLVEATNWQFYNPDVSIQEYQAQYRDCLTDIRNAYVGCYRLPTVRVVTGTTENGTPLMFIAATSMSAFNGKDDHYAYYEGLWEEQPNGAYQQIRDTHFNYDVAGLEGFTFFPLFVTLSVGWMFLGLCSAIVVVTFQTIRRLLFGKQKRKPTAL